MDISTKTCGFALTFGIILIIGACHGLQVNVTSEQDHDLQLKDVDNKKTGHEESLKNKVSTPSGYSSNDSENVTVGNPLKGVTQLTAKNSSVEHTDNLKGTVGHEREHHRDEPVTSYERHEPSEKLNVTNETGRGHTAPSDKVSKKARLMFVRYKNMRKQIQDKTHHSLRLYNMSQHLHRRGHLYFFNQFVYELKTLRSCFYQFVKKGCTLSVYYQSLNTEPVTIYVADQYDMVLHDNNLRKFGNFSLTPKHSEIFGICLENFSWETKRVFLSIRVESRRNSKVMSSSHHSMAHTLKGHISNLEVEVRSMQAHLWRRKAHSRSHMIADDDKVDFARWITWMLVLAALVIYILQVVEIHRLTRAFESRFIGGASYVRIALSEDICY